MVLGIVLSPVFLTWLQTPAEIFDDAVLYLRIFFVSGLPMVAYNLLAGVIRALGNSKSPMVYQIIGGFVNVAINILLVTVLHRSAWRDRYRHRVRADHVRGARIPLPVEA